MTASPSPHATVLTVLNLKGGVGKTHTTWLLASVSHERGKRLLAIDTDPQGNLTNSFLRDGEKTPGVERLLDPCMLSGLIVVIAACALWKVGNPFGIISCDR